jgi:hypothetical protein
MLFSQKTIMGCALAASMSVCSASHAATFPFSFSGASSGGEQQNVSATVTPGAGTLDVVVHNFISDPSSVAQNISDFTVFVQGTPITGLSSSLVTPTAISGYVNVASGGTFTFVTAPTSAAWTVTNTSSSVHVDDLAGGAGTCTPACTIIGAPNAVLSEYIAADASIAGNGPHNPFLDQNAEFLLSVAGITANTVITNFQWSFGTTPGDVASANPIVSPVPLPPAALLFGTALAGLGILGRRRRSNAQA